MRVGDTGKLFSGTVLDNEIVEVCRWAIISEIDEDGTIWACDQDGDEIEIKAEDFIKNKPKVKL